MKVSIIIPVYNAKHTIGRCMQSILAQTINQWEIIAIDDGSSDDSMEILKKYEERYPIQIRVISQENQGVAKTRDRGIREANAPYIMFVDNDDYIDNDYVETYLTAIEQSQCDCVVGGYRRVDENQKVLFQRKIETEWQVYCTTAPWARIFRREFLIFHNIKFLDYPMGEDHYFNALVYQNADEVVKSDYIGYNWVYNKSSVSNTTQKGLSDNYNPLFMLNKIDEVVTGAHKKIYQYWFLRWVIWYLLHSGMSADKAEFMKEYKRLFNWLNQKNIPLKFPLFEGLLKGETLKNRIIVNGFLMIRKLRLLPLFASVYCRGS